MMSRTSTAKAGQRRLAAAIVLTVIVRMAETVVDAVVVPAAADEIVDAADAVDVLVAADGIVAGAAGRAGEGTKNLCHGFARIHADSH